MQLRHRTWTVLLVVILHITSTTPTQFRSDDYFYLDPDMDDDDVFGSDVLEADEQPSRNYFSLYPRSVDAYPLDDTASAVEATTECEAENSTPPITPTTPTSPVATTCITVLAGVTQRPAPSATLPQTTAPTHVTTTQHPATTTVPTHKTTHMPTTTNATITTSTEHSSTTEATTTTSTSTSTTSSTTTESTTCEEEHETTTIPHTTSTIKPVAEVPETTTCTEEDVSTPKPTTLPYPYLRPVEATTCISINNAPRRNGSVNLQALGLQLPQLQAMPPSPLALAEQDGKSRALHQLVQHLYVAQARVQLEAIEIKKSQAVANSAQQQLEEAANHVRSVTAALQNAQQEVASAAIRAQTAQLQLAAHDQLLFAARQDVDALSSQMVGLQAAEGISVPTVKFDIGTLLDKLKQPLPDAERPTAVPPVVSISGEGAKPPPAIYDDYDYD